MRDRFSPSATVSPSSGACRPLSSDSSVLLPQPDGPEMRVSSPAWMATDSRSSTCTVTVPERKALLTVCASRLTGADVRAFMSRMSSAQQQGRVGAQQAAYREQA